MSTKTSTIIAIVSAVAAIVAAAATWFGSITAMRSLNSSLQQYENAQKDKEKTDWEESIVYDIIFKSTSGRNSQGLTLEQIRQQFITEAKGLNAELLGQEDLQVQKLRSVLLTLETSDRIYLAEDGKYFFNQVNSTKLSMDNPLLLLIQKGLTVLTTDHPGEYDSSGAFNELAKTIPEIRPDVFAYTVNTMLAMHQLYTDTHKKLWAAAATVTLIPPIPISDVVPQIPDSKSDSKTDSKSNSKSDKPKTGI